MNRRDFLKVCGVGAASVLAALLNKRSVAEPVQEATEETVMGVDLAAGEDEVGVFPGLDAYIRTGYEDLLENPGLIEFHNCRYVEMVCSWMPGQRPEEIVDTWTDGHEVFAYDPNGDYWVTLEYFSLPYITWWKFNNNFEIRLRHLESLRGRLALFQALWCQHIERSTEVGREIEDLSRLLARVVRENWVG